MAYSTPSSTENQLPRNLFAAVAVLGLASYGFSFALLADDAAPGWPVRFAALAALVAVFGLLPKQTPHPVMIAVLAAMGFLDGLSSVLASESGWALTAIVVLNFAQAAVAIAAALMSPNVVADNTSAGSYEAYVDYYNQAVQQYYHQQAAPAPPQMSQQAGYGQATHRAQAAQPAQRAQRPTQHADSSELAYGTAASPQPDRGRSGSGAQAPPPGLPSFGPAHEAPGRSNERTARIERQSPPQ